MSNNKKFPFIYILVILIFSILLFQYSLLNLIYIVISIISINFLNKEYDYIKKDIFIITVLYFLIGILLLKIDFADILGYQDQYFYLSESNQIISQVNSFKELFNITKEFLFGNKYQFTNWSYFVFLNRYLIGSKEAVILFNMMVHQLTILYLIKSIKNLLGKDKLYPFIISMLFLPPFIFLSSLYLKESFVSSLFLLLIFSFYNKNYLFLILVSFILFKIRATYFIIYYFVFVFLYILYRQNSNRGRIIIGSLTFFLLFSIFTYVSSSGSNLKVFYYYEQVSEGYSKSKVASLTSQSIVFLDKDNLLSPKNLVLLPIIGLVSPPVTRFIKAKNIESYLESFMVMFFWWILFPYFLVVFLPFNLRLQVPILSGFIAIIFASSFSLISIAPELFRYRLPIFGLFILGSFIGYNQLKMGAIKVDIYLRFIRFKKYWYLITLIFYFIYIII